MNPVEDSLFPFSRARDMPQKHILCLTKSPNGVVQVIPGKEKLTPTFVIARPSHREKSQLNKEAFQTIIITLTRQLYIRSNVA